MNRNTFNQLISKALGMSYSLQKWDGMLPKDSISCQP